MRAQLALVCVYCACAVWLSCASAEQQLRICGRELAETLILLCKDRGGFNEPPPPHLRAADASSGRGGVADDCCRRGCTLSTLRRYCKFDDVVRPQPQGECADDEDDQEDQLFSLQLLHRQEAWCGTWQPAAAVRPGGEVECTCSRGGGSGDQLENVVRKGPRQRRRQRPRQPARQPRRPTRQPPTSTTPATRRPVIRGTATPYFAGRPVAVVLSPPLTQRLSAAA